MIAAAIARFWLGGAKYFFSERLAGRDWHLPLSAALAKHGLSLNGKGTLREVVDTFKGRVRWKEDLFFQLWDTVLPPVRLLAVRGDDCDGTAMLHAQAIQYALGPLGWRGRIVSVFADPWRNSHHFAIGVDHQGQIWAVQPEPSETQDPDLDPIWPTPFLTIEEAANEIMATYGSKVVWCDVRNGLWGKAKI